jgi:cytidylate kinase
MLPQPSLGRAEVYLNVHLSRTGQAHYNSRSPGPFVTISRESGSGGSTLAQALIPRLERAMPGDTPWTVFDRNLVEAMLESRHLSSRIARFLPEDRVSEINASIGELIGLHPNIWNLIQRTNDMMRELARAGHAILVGRGANFATAGIPNGLHLRLVAPVEQRAEHMARELGVDFEHAILHNNKTDAARRSYVRSVFDCDVERPSAYDLVVNMGRLSLDQVTEQAALALHSRVTVLS